MLNVERDRLVRMNNNIKKNFKKKHKQIKQNIDNKSLFKKISWIMLTAIVTSAVCIILLQYFQMNFDWEQTIDTLFRARTKLFVFQILIVSLLYFLFIAIIKSRLISSSVFFLAALIISVVNQQKILYRDEPFYPSDFSMIEEVPFLLKTVDIKVVISVGSAIAFFVILVIALTIYKNKNKKITNENKKIVNLLRVVTFVFSSVCLIYVYNFNQPANFVKNIFDKNAVWTSFSQRKNYVENGFVAGFLYNLNAPAVEKPNNYSEKKIESIVQKYGIWEYSS